MNSTYIKRSRRLATALVTLTVLASAAGCRVDGVPAPDVNGEWDLQYDDQIQLEITLGGATYKETIGANGGTVTIDHEGEPISFDLDCSKPEIVCPSEVWAASVTMDQRDDNFPRRVWVTIPQSQCDGSLAPADPSECGAGTNNVDCEDVCDGEVTVTETERFGSINKEGDHMSVLLGAGIASNGINCAMLGISIAEADLGTTGGIETGDWEGQALSNGEVAVGYAGGCLWAGDPDGDGNLEALVLGASIKISTGFTGTKG